MSDKDNQKKMTYYEIFYKQYVNEPDKILVYSSKGSRTLVDD